MIEAWHAWKKDPENPDTVGALYKAAAPTINHAVHNMAATGIATPALEAEARKLAMKAFKTYDPEKAQLNTHLTHHLKGLQRYADKHSQSIRLPENKARASEGVFRKTRELADSLGRTPTVQEISEHTGIGESSLGGLMRYQTHLYSLNEGGEGMGQPLKDEATELDVLNEFLYHSLPPQHKIVFQHTIGYGEHPQLQAGEIAKLLKVKPSRVSAIKKDITKRAEAHLSAIQDLMGD